jgi:hypothetical protein
MENVQLTLIHWIYVMVVLAVIVTMAMRRDTVLPCILGLFIIGFAFSGDLVRTIQIIFNALVAAGTEFLGIITVISLVVAMSKAMGDVGVDRLIMQPAAKLMISPNAAFFVVGLAMMIVAWFVWPSPAVALIGALLLPAAVRAGLPVIGAAVAMNIFGHGIALSSDWIIQGAPGLTAKFAGLPDATAVTNAGVPLYFTMAIVTVGVAFYMLKRDMAANKQKFAEEALAYQETKPQENNHSAVAGVFAILIPAAFLLVLIAMLILDLRGGDATALIGGTALTITALLAVAAFKDKALERVTDYVRDGFMFGIKVFAPVIVIGAFFFLGAEGTAKAILGEGATGLLTDIGKAMAGAVPMSAIPVAFIQMIIGGITGLDGSGFSGLPLTGSLAQTFGTAINADVGVLAALGQIAAVWVGGGTIIPWGLIPVAAICGVSPMELARRNFLPVIIGLLATTVVAIILL